MLNNTFIHLPGIGLKTETDFWDAGVRTWSDFRPPFPNFIAPAKSIYLRALLDEAADNLSSRPDFFTALLPAAQHWRIFPHFQGRTAYLDIETTGLSEFCAITTIAIYDGRQIKYYVHGENLEEFPDDIMQYDVLVTYNGKSFDVPVINRYFGIELAKAHIDLRYVLHNLGIKGGLKGCEKRLGLDRGDLEGTDGFMAVRLWEHYQRSGERSALETLLAYNIMDTVNLELLMVEAYNRNLALTPFYDELKLARPEQPENPFKANRQLLLSLQPGPGNLWPANRYRPGQ